MPRSTTLKEGQMVKYIGKNIKDLDVNDPYVKVLGYDSNDWNLIWVEYNGKRMHVQQKDLEVI